MQLFFHNSLWKYIFSSFIFFRSESKKFFSLSYWKNESSNFKCYWWLWGYLDDKENKNMKNLHFFFFLLAWHVTRLKIQYALLSWLWILIAYLLNYFILLCWLTCLNYLLNLLIVWLDLFSETYDTMQLESGIWRNIVNNVIVLIIE